MQTRILVIGESDSSGRAGIQADCRIVSSLGAIPATAITSLLVQTSDNEFHELEALSPKIVSEQIKLILDNNKIDAIKIGRLRRPEVMDAIGDILDERFETPKLPIVCDPVVWGWDGTVKLDTDSIATLKRRIFVRSTVLTPDIKEAELLTGIEMCDIDNIRHAADMMRTYGPESIVLKGTMLDNKMITDILIHEDSEEMLQSPKLENRPAHGAGGTTATAIATYLAQGITLPKSVVQARAHINQTIAAAA